MKRCGPIATTHGSRARLRAMYSTASGPVSIQGLFPFLYQNQLLLFMMTEPVAIELFFSKAIGGCMRLVQTPGRPWRSRQELLVIMRVAFEGTSLSTLSWLFAVLITVETRIFQPVKVPTQLAHGHSTQAHSRSPDTVAVHALFTKPVFSQETISYAASHAGRLAPSSRTSITNSQLARTTPSVVLVRCCAMQ